MSKPISRSMIPNYAIGDMTDVTITRKRRKRKSDYPSFGTEKYSDSMLIVNQSAVYDTLVRYTVMLMVTILIMLAMTPLCIIIIKKWKWKWVIKLAGIKIVDTSTVSNNDPMISSNASTPYQTPIAYHSPTYPMSTNNVTPVGVNTTGTGIDINKPYIMPTAVLQQFTNSMQ